MADVTATFASLNSTESSNSPAGGTAVGTGLDDNLRTIQSHIAAARDAAGWFGLRLTSVSGTNTVVGSVAAQGSITMAPTAYATGQRYHFIPAATNTGATTLNVSTLGAKSIFWNGAACAGGELRINVPCCVEYDGTQFHIVGNGIINHIPQNSQSTAYTTVLTDSNKHILHPTADNNARTFTIDSNANVPYPIGTCITIVNQINTVTIAITSDTLTLAGTSSTGSRTLAANGIATAIKIGSTQWLISGVGLT